MSSSAVLSLLLLLATAGTFSRGFLMSSSVRAGRGRVVKVAAQSDEEDVNTLMTELNMAVAREDFATAAACKKRLDSLMANEPLVRGDWAANGAPAWLNTRLGDLQMRFPTPVQSRSLGLSEEDLVIRAPTGSGKTLAFLTPILGGLTEDLEARERTTSTAVQNASVLTPTAAMEALSPALRTSARVMTTRLPSLAPPRGPPLALIIAPSSALCMQHANAAYTLVGGNLRDTYFPGDKASLFAYAGPKGVRVVALASEADARRAVTAALNRDLGLSSNRGDDEEDGEPIYDDLTDCDVLVADSKSLCDALDALGHHEHHHKLFDASVLKYVAVDEADACANVAADALKRLDVPASSRRFVVGATLDCTSPSLAALLVSGRPTAVVESSSASVVRLDTIDQASSSKLAGGTSFKIPPGLRHTACRVDEWRRLGVLARMMRRDLDDWARSEEKNAPSENADDEKQQQLPRPRCVVFCQDEASAKKAASRLRRALWGDHAVAALLPSLGNAPLEQVQSFGRTDLSRANANFSTSAANDGATVLVTASLAARGLSFANVTRVFVLGMPKSPEDYTHMAGRTGRVGQQARGTVTTLLNDTEFSQLQTLFANTFPDLRLDEIPQREAAPPPPAVVLVENDDDDEEPREENKNDEETTKQQRLFLEDLINLYDEEDSASVESTPLRPRKLEDDE